MTQKLGRLWTKFSKAVEAEKGYKPNKSNHLDKEHFQMFLLGWATKENN